MNRRGFLKALGLGTAAAVVTDHQALVDSLRTEPEPKVVPATTRAPMVSGGWSLNEISLVHEPFTGFGGHVRKVNGYIPVTREVLDDQPLPLNLNPWS